MTRELITWRGTPGTGDFGWALNCAHNYAYSKGVQVLLEFHWEHDKDHLHHFEDPETIIERLDYLHNFYHRKDDVKVLHIYNAVSRYKNWKWGDDVIEEDNGDKRVAAISRPDKARFWWSSEAYSDKDGSPIPPADWLFRDDAFRETNNNKVVIWRPTFNAEVPRTWKRELTNDQWDVIIGLLRGAGLDVVELTYRTPVSEALYEISTCRMVLCYDGMWHYVARNLYRPMIVISNEGITKYHTPHCVRTSHREDEPTNIWYWVKDIPKMLGHTKQKASGYERKIRKIYHERQINKD